MLLTPILFAFSRSDFKVIFKSFRQLCLITIITNNCQLHLIRISHEIQVEIAQITDRLIIPGCEEAAPLGTGRSLDRTYYREL